MMDINIALKCFAIILLCGQIRCDDDDDEVMAKVEPANSNVTVLQWINNGQVAAKQNASAISNRVSSYDQHEDGNCGGIFRNIQNLILSPKFISARPISNLRCEYSVVSPYICENEFHVQFLDFAIDSSENCTNEKVVINYEDPLCGKIIGVKRYRTIGGVLNITFVSNSWDSNGKLFRLLVTRLPCIEKMKENQTEADALEPSAIPEVDEDRCYHVNTSYTISGPSYDSGHPIYGVPAFYNRTHISGRQDVPVIPLPIPENPDIYPPQPIPIPPIQPIFPPPFIQQCCRNTYNQQRFLLISQGFPAFIVGDSDCLFIIHRNSPNICRLRIVFKYFVLDDPAAGQFGCINNFIEIDGQRICGCKSNFIYETEWGIEPKIIRLRTVPGRYPRAQGFVMDVIQEQCPFKIQQQFQLPVKSKSEKLFLHPLLIRQQAPLSFPLFNQYKPNIDENVKSKFFAAEQNFISNNCAFNHLTLLQIKLETFGIFKHFCLPFY